MKTKILLEAKGKEGIFEDTKLQVEGSHVALEELLILSMEQSEGFYEVIKGALETFEEKGKN